ncbi:MULTISPECIES: hypothetical protein [unclassified Endozoicomonas]|uniref:hypothetical protein n=1 Tax=unclassified Endozoicomonas TaxID=2644528 RepID=UPI003BB76907
MDGFIPSISLVPASIHWICRKISDATQADMDFLLSMSASEYGKIEAGLLTWKDDQASVFDLLDITWDQLDQPLTEYNHNHRDRAMGEVL